MPTYLLDKNVVSRAATGIAKAEVGLRLTAEEDEAVTILYEGEQGDWRLFISPETDNILRHRAPHPAIRQLLGMVEVMSIGKYFKRWARRLRQLGFTREDAKVLSLGTFGADETGDILGVEAVVTLDRRMANNYDARRTELQRRLAALCSQLSEPYNRAALPAVRYPADIVRQLEKG